MYESSYRVGGDLYRLQEEARRRSRGERSGSGTASSVRQPFTSRPTYGAEAEWDESLLGDDWGRFEGSGAPAFHRQDFEEQRAYEPIPPPPPSSSDNGEAHSGSGISGLLGKLNLRTEDLILIGLIIFLIYSKADWDLIIILGILFFVGWRT